MADVGRDAGKSGIEAKIGANDTQAVGAKNADAIATRDFQCFSFKRCAGVSGFSETRRDDDDVFDAAAAALLDQVGDCSRAGGNDCQIDAGANVFNRLIGFDVEDGFVFGIDRVKAAFIARGGNVFEQDVADRVVPIRCADDGDRFGLK